MKNKNTNKVKQSQTQNIIIHTSTTAVKKRRRNKRRPTNKTNSVSLPTTITQYRYLPQQQPLIPSNPFPSDNRLASLENSLGKIQEHLKSSGKSVHQAVNLQQMPVIPKSITKFPNYNPFNSPPTTSPPKYGLHEKGQPDEPIPDEPIQDGEHKSEEPIPEPRRRTRVRIPRQPEDVNTEDERESPIKVTAEPVDFMDKAFTSPVKAKKAYERQDPYPNRNDKWFHTIDPEEKARIFEWKDVKASKRPDYRAIGLLSPPATRTKLSKIHPNP
jgi:hypothetical protein